VTLVFATDRCHVLDDPWRDQAVPIRFHDEAAAVAAILERAGSIAGVVCVGDRPTTIAARVQAALGLPGHPPEAAAVARHKRLTRERLRAAGLPVPWFRAISVEEDARDALAKVVSFPCVLKPVGLSGSRGVMRADDRPGFRQAFDRLARLLCSPDARSGERGFDGEALVEGFVPGREFAVEAIVHDAVPHVLAIFDKPDPLDGPFFEETIYVTPSSASDAEQRAIVEAVGAATAAIGLRHGPVHAGCRGNDAGVFVLEAAARPIGGLCARALRFEGPSGRHASLEELLLRQALGESPAGWQRERGASGVMMIPIPRRGILRRVGGVEAALEVPGVTDLRITAKPGYPLLPLPEGATYLGFIFAGAADPAAVDAALRSALGRLQVDIDSEIPVVQSRHG
jgi:ATP-grasp domain/L-amino acid ligase C-terminal domain 2